MHSFTLRTTFHITQYFIDCFSLIFAFVVSYLISFHFILMYDIGHYIWILLIYALSWIYLMTVSNMYDVTTFYYNDRILRSCLKSTVFSSAVFFTIAFLLKINSVSRLFTILYITFSFIFLLSDRYLCKYIYRTRNTFSRHISLKLFIGSAEDLKLYLKYMQKTQIPFRMSGHVTFALKQNVDLNAEAPYLGSLKDLESILKKTVVDEVVFSVNTCNFDNLSDYFSICESVGVTVMILLNIQKNTYSYTLSSMLGPIPTITLHNISLNKLQKTGKRAVDIVGSIAGLLLTAVASIFIAPIIKLSSPGPVLFKQTRIGLNGREFKIYKFRTMYKDADKRKSELLDQNEHSDNLMFKMKDDPRITSIGKILRKTSLDELPQFFNVLHGDMSLVGTRPPLPNEVSFYETKYLNRLSIKPGITGMWQVSGRSDIKDFKDIVDLDRQYIENWSILLDFVIILKTVKLCIYDRKAAY